MFVCKTIEKISAKLLPLWDLTARVFIANIFWKSGLTKIDNWEATLWLFKKEYSIPFVPSIAAYLGTGVELLAPIMLVFGFGTRLAALGILGLSIVAHIIYPTFHEHYFWMLLSSAIMLRGPEMLSLDHWMCNRKKK